MFEIEQNLWKNRIKSGKRENKDWLDVSQEDFSKYKTKDINGNEVSPSTFNIFRDSLSQIDA